MKLFMKIVSSPTLLDNISELDPLLSTDSWQTLMAFTRESARKLFLFIRGIDNFTEVHQLLALRPPLLEAHTTMTFLRKCWIKLQQMRWEEPELLMKGLESVPIVLLRTITPARTVMFVGCLCNVYLYWISLRVKYSTRRLLMLTYCQVKSIHQLFLFCSSYKLELELRIL